MPTLPTQADSPVAALADDLPLRYQTPPRWAAQVMADSMALLNDHAHLEKKAGANALELLNRWPLEAPLTNGPPTDATHHALTIQWVQTMTAVAKGEVDHLGTVLRILFRRAGRFTKSHSNAYAASLRKMVRVGRGPEELLDRLIISALIEARSCERFEVLGEHCNDDELRQLYRDLANSERGHFTVFLNLARQLPGNLAVESRWDRMLDAEAATIASQPPGPRMHSGVLP